MGLRGGAIRAGVAALGCVLALAAGAAGAGAQSLPSYVQPYGFNDAGGFYNVLPPGENGLDNAVDLLRYEGTGALPANFDDQQPLYENLLYASQTLTPGQIPDYFKDATFGVR